MSGLSEALIRTSNVSEITEVHQHKSSEYALSPARALNRLCAVDLSATPETAAAISPTEPEKQIESEE